MTMTAGLTLLTLALVAADPPDAPLVALAEAEAGTEASPAPPPPAAVPTELVIRPAGEPRPALRYRILPERRSLVPGNAAQFYLRAILMATQTRASLDRPPVNAANQPTRDIEQKINRWNIGPIAAIPREEAANALQAFDASLREVDLAVRRLDCDWAHFERTEGITLMIPEIQEMRTLARLVQLRTLLAIRDGRAEDAFRGVQSLYVMGRHTADGPTLIGGLVGIAITNLATHLADQLVQMPGAPNLYWALANRPRPLIDLAPAIAWESDFLERELPGIDRVEDRAWSLDESRRFADLVDQKIFQALGHISILGDLGMASRSGGAVSGKPLLAVAAAQGEATARRELLAAGLPADRVAAMPSFQAVTAAAYRRFQALRDDEYKRIGLPPWQSLTRPWMGLTLEQKRTDPILTLFGSLMPAVNAAEVAVVRTERRLDALQAVEAIRLHLASHDGQWPATLDALGDNPAPLDPATGKPFEYRVTGDTATISAPVGPGFPHHHTSMIHYVLKLAR